MKIVVDEKELDEIINAEALKYKHAFEFMKPDETKKDFDETIRGQMLESIQNSISNIRNKLRDV